MSNHRLVGSKGFALGGSRAEPWPCFLPSFPRAGNGHEVSPDRLGSGPWSTSTPGRWASARPRREGREAFLHRRMLPAQFGMVATVKPVADPSAKKRRIENGADTEENTIFSNQR